MASLRSHSMRVHALSRVPAMAIALAVACGSNASPGPQEIGYNGLHGYISDYVPTPPDGYGFGVSLYSSAWPLTQQPLRNFQIGLPSTWIIPNNAGYAGDTSLCPPGTLAHDLGWGPDYEIFFQTIEGGMGFWGSTQFKSATPKYRMNGTPDCYSTEISSPGWGFGNPAPLADAQMGIVQLSNRLLVPPDGLTFQAGVNGQLMGIAWMALPFSEYQGYYWLQYDLDPSLCLRGNSAGSPAFGGGAYMDACGSSDEQLWQITPSASDGYYTLRNLAAGSGMCLEGNTGQPSEAEGGRSYMAACSASDGQLWTFAQRGNAKFHWQTKQAQALNLCLEGNTPAPASWLGGAAFMASCGGFTGQTWHVAPQEPAGTLPVGIKNWTLFLNSSNFKGPVAYWIADTWAAIANGYPVDAGRGLDALPATANSGGMEFNTVPWFIGTDASNVTYTRIPRLQFPVDGSERTVLMQDVAFHSSATLFDNAWTWFHGGNASDGVFDTGNAHTYVPANCSVNTVNFDQATSAADSTTVALTGIDAFVTTALFDANTCTWGLQWSGAEDKAAGMALFPEYFKQSGAGRVAVTAANVPAETQLAGVSFASTGTPADYTSPATGAWATPGAASAPVTVALVDGSAIRYAWYRFVDQPALQHLGLSAAAKDHLQQVVAAIHANWPIDRDYLAPPSSGTLLALDGALLVTPPPAMATGYVPIVLDQFPDRVFKNGFD